MSWCTLKSIYILLVSEPKCPKNVSARLFTFIKVSTAAFATSIRVVPRYVRWFMDALVSTKNKIIVIMAPKHKLDWIERHRPRKTAAEYGKDQQALPLCTMAHDCWLLLRQPVRHEFCPRDLSAIRFWLDEYYVKGSVFVWMYGLHKTAQKMISC